MANNRLYLVDKRTGHTIMLAKGFATWSLWPEPGVLDAFLAAHDFEGAQGGPVGLELKSENDEDCPLPLAKMWTPEDGS